MVIRFLLCLLWLTSFLFASSGYAEVVAATENNELNVSISRTDKQLGQYLRATLRYSGPLSLTTINLEPWRQRFAIIVGDDYQDEDNQGNVLQILKLRLYPRIEGEYTLPALKLGSGYSQKIKLNISPAVVNRAPINLNWEISNLSPWQREAVVIRVHLESTDNFSNVILETTNNKKQLLRPLNTYRHTLTNGNTIFDAGWLFYPLSEGSLTLDLPAIRYQLSGSDRRHFYLPLQKLNIHALPGYLPPDLPIGKLTLQSKIKYTDSKHWETVVKTPALVPFGTPEMDKQLATISRHDISNIQMTYSQDSSYQAHGDRNIYLTPLPEWLMPIGNRIELKLRYFNPQTGRLETVSHTLPRHWFMPQWAWILTIIFSLLLSIVLINKLQPLLLTQINRFKLRQKLTTVESTQELRKLILNNGEFITLSEWARLKNCRAPLADRLNKICFTGSDESELETLRNEIHRCV